MAHAPLVEALCEIRFNADAAWDWTIPGQLYERIRHTYPDTDSVVSMEVQVKAINGPPTAKLTSQPERVQLKNKDGSSLVQLGPHLLVVNHLRPYPGWETFRQTILTVLAEYQEVARVVPIARIGLRYINQLDLPPKGTHLRELLTISPPLTGSLDQPLASFYQRYEIMHETPKGVLILQCGVARKADQASLMLDLDFVATDFAEPSIESVASHLEEAHLRIEEGFRTSLNPTFLERLERD